MGPKRADTGRVDRALTLSRYEKRQDAKAQRRKAAEVPAILMSYVRYGIVNLPDWRGVRC